jgi:hypothetical protein
MLNFKERSAATFDIKSILLFFGVFLCFATSSSAQSGDTVSSANKIRLNLTFQPLFLINNALKFDFEVRPAKGKWAFIGGAEFYRGNIGSLHSRKNEFGEPVSDKIKGHGINLALKYNLSGSDKKGHFYVSPGMVWRSLELQLKGPMFYSYTEYNVEYITYGEAEASYRVKPFLGYANLGYQLSTGIFVFDVYTGVGYKTSKKIADLEQMRNYDQHFYGYTHKGMIVQGGIKLGVRLK